MSLFMGTVVLHLTLQDVKLFQKESMQLHHNYAVISAKTCRIVSACSDAPLKV